MLSPEQRGDEPAREPALSPAYYQAARYADEEQAGAAYFQAQEVLFTTKSDMSAYRFQLEQAVYVAVLGDTPSAEFDQTLQAILASGEPATLPAAILIALNQRRIQARRLAPWVERHYRPGKPIAG